MAEVPDSPLVVNGGAPPSPNPTERTVTFKRNLFIKKEETGLAVTRRDQLAEGTTSEKVTFGEELQEQYRRFLDDYVTNLNELRKTPDPANPNRTLLDTVLSNPQHVYDKELMSVLSEEVLDKNGRVIDRRVNEGKIGKFLEDSRGWMITTQLLEYQTTMKLFALGLHAATRPPGERQAMADPNLIHLGIGQGGINALIHDRMLPWLNERVTMVAGRTNLDSELIQEINRRLPPQVANVASNIVGNLRRWQAGLGLGVLEGGLYAVGNVPAAAIGAISAALIHSDRPGLTLDLRQCTAAFEAIQANPTEAAYVKAIAGIDVNDYVITGVNQIALVTGRPRTMRNAESDLKKEVLGGLYTRMEFYSSLGVPPESLDALPSQAQYWFFTEGQPEQTGARWLERAADRFTDLGGVGPNMTVNIERYMQAQRDIMLADIKDYMRIEQTINPQTETVSKDEPIKISNLEAKKTARTAQGEGSLRAERERQFTERKTMYEGDSAVLQAEKQGKMTPYQEAFISLQNARDEAQREFGVSDITAIDAAIATRQQGLTDPTIPGSYAARLDNLEMSRRTEIATQVGAIPATLVGNARNQESARRVEEVNNRFNRLRAILKEDVADKVEQEVTVLKRLRGTIQENERKLRDNEAVVTQARENIDALQTDFTAVTGWNGVGGVVLTDVELRTQPIDELIRRINTANTANAAVGWPEAQNGREQVRRRVLHAMVEARAREINPAIVASSANLTTLTGAPHNLSENQLRVLTANEINARLPAGTMALPDIEAVKTEVQSRFVTRDTAYDQQDTAFNELIAEQDDNIAAINFDQEVRRLDITVDVMQRQGEIYSSALEFAYDSARFVNINPPVAGNPDFAQYTRQEQTFIAGAAAPRGYYEIMDVIFNYKDKPNREEYFQRASQLLSPDRLAQLLNDSLDLGIAPPTIAAVLAAVDNGLNTTGVLASPNIRGSFRDIVNQLYNEANAL